MANFVNFKKITNPALAVDKYTFYLCEYTDENRGAVVDLYLGGMLLSNQDELEAAVDTLTAEIGTKAAQSALDALAQEVAAMKGTGEGGEGDLTLGGLSARLTTAEGAIETEKNRATGAEATLQQAIDTKVSTDTHTAAVNAINADIDKLEKAISDEGTGINAKIAALEAADEGIEAQLLLVATKEELNTAKTGLENQIKDKADKSALDEVSEVANAAVKQSDYDTKIAALDAEDKRIVGLVEAEAELARAAEKANKDAIDAIKEDYVTKAEKTALEGSISGVDAKVTTLIGTDDANKSVRTIANEELAKQLIAEGAQESLDTLAEIAAWIQEHPEDAAAMNLAIENLQKEDITLDGRLDVLEAKFGDGDGSVADMIDGAKEAAIAAAEADAKSKADAAEAAAKSHADGLNTAMNTRVEALEAIDHEHSNKALLDTYTQTEANLADAVAKKHEHSNLTVLNGITAEKITAWDSAESNAKNEAATNLASAKTELETKITAAQTAAAADAAAKDVVVLSEAQSYVDGKVEVINTALDGKADSNTVSTLSNTVSTLSGTVEGHTTSLGTISGQITALQESLKNVYTKDVVYTKTEVNNLLSDYYNKSEIDDRLTWVDVV